MRKKNITGFLLLLSLLLTFCYCAYNQTNQENKTTIQEEINFGELEIYNTSSLKINKIIKLQLTSDCILSTINQVEVYYDKLYILDEDKICVFTLNGSFVKKLDRKGNGPGEFMLPRSFHIDDNGLLYLHDLIGMRLLAYNAESLDYLKKIELPYLAPYSFIKMPDKNLIAFYYSLRPNENRTKHIVLSSDSGIVYNELLPAKMSGKIMHGSPRNIYSINGKIRVYPNFSNLVYELQQDSALIKYKLIFGNRSFPPDDFFQINDNKTYSHSIMEELLSGNNEWIRLMYVYESVNNFIVKYYIKRDFHIANWNKKTNKTLHFKVNEAGDDIGIGGHFPIPIGFYKDQIMGVLYPYEMDINQLTKPEIQNIDKNNMENNNPILVLYTF